MLAVGMGARRSEFLTPVLKRNSKDQGGKNEFGKFYPAVFA